MVNTYQSAILTIKILTLIPLVLTHVYTMVNAIHPISWLTLVAIIWICFSIYLTLDTIDDK